MDIYLDIDGTIKGVASPKEDVIEFLNYILRHFPDSTYWLTTHCNAGYNNVREALTGEFPDKLVDELCKKVKPTEFVVMKTAAIDFSRDFVWFDDTLMYVERDVLIKNNAENEHFLMNPKDPESVRAALDYLKMLSITGGRPIGE